MASLLESYMEAEKLPETTRQLLREQAQHSVSCYGLNGQYLQNGFDKENLLAVLVRMERYIIDSNLLGSVCDAKEPKNRDKAFILGQTAEEETDNLEALLFGQNVDNSNNNLFIFGLVGPDASGLPAPYLTIDRLDSHHQRIFNTKGLQKESRQRVKRMLDDMEFIERERKGMADVLHFKEIILKEILRWPDITRLPPIEFNECKKVQLIEMIRAKAPSCFTNYSNAVCVASLCYAALLLEPDKIGVKTRNEFCEPNRRNVFGDTRLIQNALWLNARILSNDGAVTRMVEYLGLSEVTVANLLPFILF
jgi:hypothetical protein